MDTRWHADGALMTLYATGALDEARACSLEAHMVACPQCRSLAAATVTADPEERARFDRSWTEVVERIDAPRTGVVERGLLLLGVRGHIARLLAATPSLRTSWFGAEAIALGFAVLAAHGSPRGPKPGGGPSDLIFLLIAPLLPLAGVAAAFGPGVDPTYEIGMAAPMGSLGVLLLRAIAVLVSSFALAGAAALALPGLDWTAAAWLLPSLGLTMASIAFATAIAPLWAAGTVTAIWVTLVMASAIPRHDHYLAFRAPAQFAFLIVTCLGALIITRRREAFERRREV